MLSLLEHKATIDTDQRLLFLTMIGLFLDILLPIGFNKDISLSEMKAKVTIHSDIGQAYITGISVSSRKLLRSIYSAYPGQNTKQLKFIASLTIGLVH